MTKLWILSAIATAALTACKKPAIPNAGDPCVAGDGIDEFCGADQKTLLKCLDGVFVAHYCTACTQTFDVGLMNTESTIAKANCSLVNHASAKIGALCDEGDSACEDNGRHSLKCVGGKLVAVSTCGGPNGCAFNQETNTIKCDTSVGEPGDICRAPGGACSADGHAFLVCKDGRLVVGQECIGPDNACTNVNHQLSCANPFVGELGKPCYGPPGCALDGSALYKCENGVFVPGFTCKKKQCALNEAKQQLDCH